MKWEFLSSRIKLARDARDLTQIELAKRLNVPKQQLSEWELGICQPNQSSLMKICNALNTHPKFFFVNSGNVGNLNLEEEATA